MKRKLGLAAVALGSILTIAAPQTALANDHDRDYRDRGYYDYHDSRTYMTPRERREYEKRLERERKEQEKAWKRSQKAYRNGYYNGYSNGYNNGYYDQYGYWHGSR
jgi:flagellar biosynthesis/type III secretory pathway protein FliH